jgi:hypothetical protein
MDNFNTGMIFAYILGALLAITIMLVGIFAKVMNKK